MYGINRTGTTVEGCTVGGKTICMVEREAHSFDPGPVDDTTIFSFSRMTSCLTPDPVLQLVRDPHANLQDYCFWVVEIYHSISSVTLP